VNKPGLGELCRASDGRCVECLSDAECSGSPAASVCSRDGSCTACTIDDDCTPFSGKTSCLPGRGCVECTSNADCTGNAAGPICNVPNGGEVLGSAPTNTCVKCTSNADCSSPDASRCETNRCVSCETNLDCSHVDSTPGAGGGVPLNVCDGGSCVQCTGLQRDACGANVCDSITKQCTAFPAGGADLCEACLSDAHCAPDARCVEQTVGLESIGFFCFPLQSNGFCTQSFAEISPAIATIDTPSALVCLQRLTTCPAYLNYTSGLDCADEADDEACGPEGLCELDVTGFNCTISCVGQDDCDPTSSCLATGICQRR
jgi:hypothetical protein